MTNVIYPENDRPSWAEEILCVFPIPYFGEKAARVVAEDMAVDKFGSSSSVWGGAREDYISKKIWSARFFAYGLIPASALVVQAANYAGLLEYFK